NSCVSRPAPLTCQMPSMYTPTFGMPRIRNDVCVVPAPPLLPITFRFGTVAFKLSSRCSPRISRLSPVIATTEIGTSCRSSARRVAVTTISSRPWPHAVEPIDAATAPTRYLDFILPPIEPPDNPATCPVIQISCGIATIAAVETKSICLYTTLGRTTACRRDTLAEEIELGRGEVLLRNS